MLSFLQRTASDTHKSFVIGMTPSAFALCNISPDRIDRSDQLLANGIRRKVVPTQYDLPNPVR